MAIPFIDLCSGIGGFHSGLVNTGHYRCVGHAEIDKNAEKAYNAIYGEEGGLNYGDLRTINPRELPHFDLLCGGFPCQSFSVAGRRLGFRDTRGTVFFEIARILAEKRPPFLLLENVLGLLSHDSGRTLNTIFSALVEMGYMTDEEVLNLLADSKISVSPESGKEKYTLGQRAADAIAKFAGSWAFIFSFTGGLVLWMVVNTLMAARAFDPYPFILLNLVLSCIAAIQAPLIMMSQNRQEEKDRRRAENDYKVNLKTEIMIEDLYDKVNAILAKQSALEKQLQGKSKMDEQKPQ